eukprot:GHVT01088765.1.p1 GENE.GHVT01088765.1~~GHVT01088765.1.p1  ORF type:complete len:157 (+),score=18.16 GHVT01088765.1:298-768(+)
MSAPASVLLIAPGRPAVAATATDVPGVSHAFLPSPGEISEICTVLTSPLSSDLMGVAFYSSVEPFAAFEVTRTTYFGSLSHFKMKLNAIGSFKNGRHRECLFSAKQSATSVGPHEGKMTIHRQQAQWASHSRRRYTLVGAGRRQPVCFGSRRDDSG